MQQSSQRLYWIDWLRVIAVLLIFPFHSARVFDVFEQFYAKGPIQSAALSWFPVAFFSLWQMPLLFLLAGMSSYFALGKRTGRQFIGERALRLLVPFFFGCLIIVPPQVWYGVRTNTGYTGSLVQFYGDYFSGSFGLVSDYVGGPSFGHLWFIIYLFVVSAVSLPLLLWARRGSGGPAMARVARGLAHPLSWLAVAFVLLLSTALPDLGGHNPFTFLVWFILGFTLMNDDGALAVARKWRWPLLATGIVMGVAVGVTYSWRDTLPDPSVGLAGHEFAVQLCGLVLCLAAVGLAMHRLDTPSRTLSYLAEASYPTYILHQTVIVVFGFYLVRVLPSPIPSWGVLTLASLATCYVTYELLIRRWAPMRWLFGMRPKPAPSPRTAE